MHDFLIVYSKDKYQDEVAKKFIAKGRSFLQKALYRNFEELHCQGPMSLLAASSEEDSDLRIFEGSDGFFAWKGGWFYLDRTNNPETNPAVFFKEYSSHCSRTGLLRNIDGVFNFVIWEKESQKLSVITDRLGLAPLYRRKIKGVDLISSSCMLLAFLDAVQLDHIGVMEFILTGKHFEDRTAFLDIKKLDSGSVYEFRPQDIDAKITQYWTIHYGNSRDGKLSQADKVELLQYEMDKIARGIKNVFSNPYIDLTGGWDSRANIVSLKGCLPYMVATTSGSATDKDVVVARRIAESLGLEHHRNIPYLSSSEFSEENYVDLLEKSIFMTDGCMSAPLYVHTLNTQQVNKKMGCDVTINGSGGELYRQYWWEPSYFIYSNFKSFKFAVTGKTQFFNEYQLAKRVITQNSSFSIFDKSFSVDIYNHLYDLFGKLNKPYGKICNIDQISNVYLNYRMKNWLAGYYSATLRLNDCLSPLLMKGPLRVSAELSLRDKFLNNFLRKYITEKNHIVSEFNLETDAPTLPVSFKNMNRFLPAMATSFYGTAEKFFQKAGFKKNHAGSQIASSRDNPNLETIRRLLALNPERMKLIDIFEKAELRKFISGYRKNAAFPYKEQYENIFTMEAILERIGY
jgi:hypothetical protein